MNTPEKEPMVHSNVIQNRLKNLNLITDDKTRDRILARIPKNTLQTINQAKKNEWLPLKLYIDTNDCIAAETGEEGSYNLSVRSFKLLVDSSIVSPFFRSALNLFKIQPKTFLKLVPLFWRSIYRNCGEVFTTETGPTRIQILFKDIPRFAAANRNFLMGVAGAIHAIIAFSGAKTLVILEKFSEESREASFIASWSSNLMKNKERID